MARPALSPDQRAAADARQRASVVGALAACIVRQGYASTTIAQVAAQAKVSNSTVYSHFADKEAILIALYGGLIDRIIATIEAADADACERGLPWRERVEAGVRSYVSTMVGGGALTRAMLIEAPAVSPRVFAARQDGRRRYLELLARLHRDAPPHAPERSRPPQVLLVAAVGGINELLLGAFEESAPRPTEEIIRDATTLLCALLSLDAAA